VTAKHATTAEGESPRLFVLAIGVVLFIRPRCHKEIRKMLNIANIVAGLKASSLNASIAAARPPVPFKSRKWRDDGEDAASLVVPGMTGRSISPMGETTMKEAAVNFSLKPPAQLKYMGGNTMQRWFGANAPIQPRPVRNVPLPSARAAAPPRGMSSGIPLSASQLPVSSPTVPPAARTGFRFFPQASDPLAGPAGTPVGRFMDAFTNRHIGSDASGNLGTYRVPSFGAVRRTVAAAPMAAAGTGAVAAGLPLASYAAGVNPGDTMKPFVNPIQYGIDRTMVSSLGGDDQVRGMLRGVGVDVPEGTALGQQHIQQGIAKFNDMQKNNWMMQLHQMWSSLDPRTQQAIMLGLGGAALGGLGGGMPGMLAGGAAGAIAPYAYNAIQQGLATPKATN
jgi:hypothetical protein